MSEYTVNYYITTVCTQGLLYSGLLEELVDVLEMKGPHLMEIKVKKLTRPNFTVQINLNFTSWSE